MAGGKLLGIGPGAPAEHGDDTKDDRFVVTLNDEHNLFFIAPAKPLPRRSFARPRQREPVSLFAGDRSLLHQGKKPLSNPSRRVGPRLHRSTIYYWHRTRC